MQNIIGQEAGKSVTEEYLKRRGHSDVYSATQDASTSELHAYVKPPSNNGLGTGSQKQLKVLKEVTTSTNHGNLGTAETSEPWNV